MDERKVLGMNKNICLGISWIFFPLGIVALAVSRREMTKEERQEYISIFVLEGLMYILGTVIGILTRITPILNLLYLIEIPCLIFVIIAIVKSFKNEVYHYPIAFNLAGNFVKDLDSDK